MKIKFLLFSFLLALFSFQAHAQAWQYAQSFGGQSGSSPGSNNNQPHNMEVDDEGNSYVFGTYGAGTQFNDSTLQHYYEGLRGSFVAKYNCAGEVEWFKAISNSEQTDDQASYMVLKDNFLYLSGSVRIDNWFKTWFVDTLVIGSILYQDYPENSIYPWVPFHDYTYIIKMDLDGNIVDQHLLRMENDDIPVRSWSINLWQNPQFQRAFSIDNEGNYYIFARLHSDHYSIIHCDNEVIIDTITPEPNKLYYLLKFDPDFNLVWYKSIIEGVSDPDNWAINMDFQDMRCDSENNLYMVGFAQAYNNSETEVPPTYINLGNEQALETYGGNIKTGIGFLLKIDPEGVVVWTQQSKQFREETSSSGSHFQSLILDEGNNSIYVEGITRPLTIYSESGSIFGESDTIFNDFQIPSSINSFVAKYDMDGQYYWVRTPLSSGSFSSGLALNNNKIYATIQWNSNLQHGEDYYEFPALGLSICVWDTAGNPVSSINIPSTCLGEWDLMPYDTRINNRGEITITGTYDFGLTFGEHEIYGEGFKMFIAKYGKACPVVLDEEDEFCYGDTYRDTLLTESGDYQFVVITDVADSVINLHAEVNPELTTGITDTTFCVYENYLLEANLGYDSYAWSTGSTSYQENLIFEEIGTETVYVTLTDNNCTGVDTINILVDVCGAVHEQSSELGLNVYPVPANAYLSVDLPENTKISTYSIYNMQGQKILQKAASSESQKMSIGIEDLPAGSYVLYLQGNSQVYRAGLVKR